MLAGALVLAARGARQGRSFASPLDTSESTSAPHAAATPLRSIPILNCGRNAASGPGGAVQAPALLQRCFTHGRQAIEIS